MTRTFPTDFPLPVTERRRVFVFLGKLSLVDPALRLFSTKLANRSILGRLLLAAPGSRYFSVSLTPVSGDEFVSSGWGAISSRSFPTQGIDVSRFGPALRWLRASKQFTSPYPNFLFLGPKGTPSSPPVVPEHSWPTRGSVGDARQ